MSIKWNNVVKQLSDDNSYKEWAKLKKFFGSEKIDTLSLIEYQILRNYPRKTEMYYVVNRVSRHLGYSIPPQFGTAISGNFDSISPNLDLFVMTLKNLCASHSIYALICASICYTKKSLYSMKYANNTNWYNNAPKWLKIVLDRQHRLCQNSLLNEGDPFFFLFSETTGAFRSVNDFDYEFISSLMQEIMGFTIGEYIWSFNKFAGMKGHKLLFLGSNAGVDQELVNRRKRNVLSPVSLLKISDKNSKPIQRSIKSHGFCLGEIENGIYIVHSIDGKVSAPFYLMDMPKIHVSKYHEKLDSIQVQLYDMGYIPQEDQMRISGLTDFSSYKVKNVKPYVVHKRSK